MSSVFLLELIFLLEVNGTKEISFVFKGM